MISNKTRALTFITFHIVLKPRTIGQDNERKDIQIGKEGMEWWLFSDDTILYIENPTVATQKLLELIDEFNKVARCEINIRKSVALVYTSNEILGRESFLKISFKFNQKGTI